MLSVVFLSSAPFALHFYNHYSMCAHVLSFAYGCARLFRGEKGVRERIKSESLRPTSSHDKKSVRLGGINLVSFALARHWPKICISCLPKTTTEELGTFKKEPRRREKKLIFSKNCFSLLLLLYSASIFFFRCFDIYTPFRLVRLVFRCLIVYHTKKKLN